jgi:hypothetical protein
MYVMYLYLPLFLEKQTPYGKIRREKEKDDVSAYLCFQQEGRSR